jgi:uncharacterized protein
MIAQGGSGMKLNFKVIIPLVLSLIFIYSMMIYTFDHKVIFWYLYAFILLVGIAVALVYSNFKDELPTWNYLLFGVGYGTILYGIVKLGHLILPYIDKGSTNEIKSFLAYYAPQSIWHYIFLVLIIVVGEEMFWRGFVQQKLKHYTSPFVAVVITSLLFSISLAISGFAAGAIAALVVGIILGGLYEWKKSLPLIIVAHETFVILLFLVLPLH